MMFCRAGAPEPRILEIGPTVSNANPDNLNMIPSVGTRIVTKVTTTPLGGGQKCPVGIVGVIVSAPADSQHA